MKGTYNIISADSHVNPPPEMYAERLPTGFRERAPRVERKGDGEVQVFEGREEPPSLLSAVAGRKYEEYREVGKDFREGRAGGWDPQARLKDMDLDGVDAEVLYGSGGGGGTTLRTRDRDFRFALMQAYNDWLAEYCRAAPDRLVGIAEVPHWDVILGIKEAERARKNGLKGVLLPAIPATDGPMSAPDDQPYTHPKYEPLWAALEDMEMPVHMHLGARPLTKGLDKDRLVSISCIVIMMGEPFASLIFSGALERHPKLKAVSVESGVGWMAFFKEWMDNVFRRHRHHAGSTLKEQPSFYFQRQVRATFIEDPVGVRERHTIGLDVTMWSSDYPHSASTWPHSRLTIEEHFRGVPEGEKWKIVAGNAANLYGL